MIYASFSDKQSQIIDIIESKIHKISYTTNLSKITPFWQISMIKYTIKVMFINNNENYIGVESNDSNKDYHK